jgi:PTH1 family peptidyl-tRNA hydrolase
MVVDRLARRWRIGLERKLPGLRLAEGSIAGVSVALVKPQRYMNVSGKALDALPFPWQAKDLIVVYDDIDLPVSRLQVRRGGGTAGHRGLASLTERWSSAFDRVRIGVGRPPAGVDAAAYVLSPLTDDEMETLDEIVDRASDAVECILSEGLEKAMNRFNVRKPSAESGGTL